MRINIDKVNNVARLDQENYIDLLLKKFDMLECKLVKTPIIHILNHIEGVQKELRYLQATKNYGLKFKNNYTIILN